jgi:hypothetical protein
MSFYLPRLSCVFLAGVLFALAGRAQDTAVRPKKNAPSEKEIRVLIAELGDDSFEKREEAQKRLTIIGGPALDLLRIAAKESKDLEVRDRAGRLIVKIQETGLALFRSEFFHDFRNRGFPNPKFELTGADAGKRVKPEPEGLRVTLAAEKSEKYDAVGVATRLRVHGDFEITAGFEIVAAEPPKQGRGVYFEVYLKTNSPTSKGFAFTRYVLPNGREVYECGLKATNQQGNRETLFNGEHIAAKGKSGQLRITRIGPTIMLSVHDDAGEGFRFLYRVDLGTEDVTYLRLGANPGGAPCAIDLRIHDVRVRCAAKEIAVFKKLETLDLSATALAFLEQLVQFRDPLG